MNHQKQLQTIINSAKLEDLILQKNHIIQKKNYLWISLDKEVNGLYIKNYKTLQKRILKDLNKYKDRSYSWILKT